MTQARRNDTRIQAAADLYERCYSLLMRLRETLRLAAQHMNQLRQPQELRPDEQPPMKRALEQLRQELRQQTEDKNDPDGPLAKIVLKHLDKYWGHLIPDQPRAAGECWQRTTNQPEMNSERPGTTRTRATGTVDVDKDLARLAKALGHPLRVKIVRLLASRTNCVCGELVAELPVAQSTVSQHLKLLKEAGLIQGTIDRPRVCYCLAPGALQRLKALVNSLPEACQDHEPKSDLRPRTIHRNR